jgi:WD40 repeat protein
LALNSRLCLWDLAESKLRKAVDIPGCLILSPDGQTLAVTPREGPTSLWDTATGKERLKLQGELARGGFGLAFSPDGKTLATNATGHKEDPDGITVALWDAITGKLLRRLRLPTRQVTSLQFCPDGRTLLTSASEPIIRLWDTATGKPALQWPAHTDEIESLAFTRDGRSLVSGGLDGTVRLWEVTSGRQLRELAGHRRRCDVVAVAPNGKIILSGGDDGCIRLQDQDGQQLRRILLDGHYVLALGVSPDSKTAATWSRDKGPGVPIYHLWDLATGKALSNRPYTSTVCNAPQSSADARLVLEQFEELVDTLAIVADAGKGGGYGPGGSAPLSFLLREVATGKEILRLRQPGGLGGAQAFAPDGRTVVATAARQERVGDSWRYDNALHFWELATRKERLTIPCGSSGQLDCSQHVAFAPDGRTVATGRYDGTIQLWDLRTGKELRHAVSGTPVSCLAFSPDSRLLASGQRDGTILVWDLTPRPPSLVGKGESRLGQLEQWWADLAGEDARRAYGAVCELSAEPPQALRLFRDRLRPATEVPADKLRQLIADLDSSQFQRREAAQKKLTAFGEQAEPALRTALRDHPSAEQRRRIEGILDAVQVVRSSEELRHLRAIEVLERMGNPEAQEVLESLAKGAADARLTKEAKASLSRLANRH